MTEPLLEITDLRVSFGGVTAVQGANLVIAPGERVAVVGASGSGKSTMAHTIMGLLPGSGQVTGGTIRWRGEDITHAEEKRLRELRGKEIGLVPQDPMSNLNPVSRVGRQVSETLLAHKVCSRREAKERAIELLGQAGLPEPARRARQYPHEFSGGMRQRALIAIGLACRPALLIADEPTSALDVTVQRQILDHLEKLTQELGTALLLVTHDLGLAAERADRVVVMSDGKIVESGPARQVLTDPQEEYTRRLVAAAPALIAPRRADPVVVDEVLEEQAAVGEGADVQAADGEVADEQAVDGAAADGDKAVAEKAVAEKAVDGEAAVEKSANGKAADSKIAKGKSAEGEVADEKAVDSKVVDGKAADEKAADETTDVAAADSNVTDDKAVDDKVAVEKSAAKPVTAEPAKDSPILEVSGISKEYRIRGRGGVLRAVDNVSFTIARGRTTAIVGESGSGKTTTARMVLGLVPVTSGTIKLNGVDMVGLRGEQLRAARLSMQPVFQDPYASLDPMWTVERLIAEPLRAFGIGDRKSRGARVTELLEQVALPAAMAHRYPNELSGGQRQRVAIARALAIEPRLVVCDEAVSALDVLVQDQILTLLASLQERLGVSYLFISHDLAVVRALAHDVVVMRNGQVVEQGPVEDVLTAPADPYTRQLLDAIPGTGVVGDSVPNDAAKDGDVTASIEELAAKV
ncbi:dipeptide ABC transporter ATP-binding protein [Nocardia sp. NBC_01499]|uniref:dipeptide ABC transporter ATP-binding protein n=1 Tax=Nocardia sp. NBC_01499 TaxID=2903597 RepID=UPI00386B50E4